MIFDYLILFKHEALKGSVPGWVSLYSDQEGTSHFVGGSSNVRLCGAFLWNCLVSLEKNPTISFSRGGRDYRTVTHTMGWEPSSSSAVEGGLCIASVFRPLSYLISCSLEPPGLTSLPALGGVVSRSAAQKMASDLEV